MKKIGALILVAAVLGCVPSFHDDPENQPPYTRSNVAGLDAPCFEASYTPIDTPNMTCKLLLCGKAPPARTMTTLYCRQKEL